MALFDWQRDQRTQVVGKATTCLGGRRKGGVDRRAGQRLCEDERRRGVRPNSATLVHLVQASKTGVHPQRLVTSSATCSFCSLTPVVQGPRRRSRRCYPPPSQRPPDAFEEQVLLSSPPDIVSFFPKHRCSSQSHSFSFPFTSTAGSVPPHEQRSTYVQFLSQLPSPFITRWVEDVPWLWILSSLTFALQPYFFHNARLQFPPPPLVSHLPRPGGARPSLHQAHPS